MNSYDKAGSDILSKALNDVIAPFIKDVIEALDEEDVTTLKARNNHQAETIRTMEAEIARLTAQVADLTAERDESAHNAEILGKAQEISRKTHKALRDQNGKLAAENRDLIETLHRLKGFPNLLTEYNKLVKHYKAACNQRDAFQRTINSLVAENKALKNSNAELQGQLKVSNVSQICHIQSADGHDQVTILKPETTVIIGDRGASADAIYNTLTGKTTFTINGVPFTEAEAQHLVDVLIKERDTFQRKCKYLTTENAKAAAHTKAVDEHVAVYQGAEITLQPTKPDKTIISIDGKSFKCADIVRLADDLVAAQAALKVKTNINETTSSFVDWYMDGDTIILVPLKPDKTSININGNKYFCSDITAQVEELQKVISMYNKVRDVNTSLYQRIEDLAPYYKILRRLNARVENGEKLNIDVTYREATANICNKVGVRVERGKVYIKVTDPTNTVFTIKDQEFDLSVLPKSTKAFSDLEAAHNSKIRECKELRGELTQAFQNLDHYREENKALIMQRDSLIVRAVNAEEKLKAFINAPPAKMTSPLGLLTIDAAGMRRIIDAYNRLKYTGIAEP